MVAKKRPHNVPEDVLSFTCPLKIYLLYNSQIERWGIHQYQWTFTDLSSDERSVEAGLKSPEHENYFLSKKVIDKFNL